MGTPEAGIYQGKHSKEKWEERKGLCVDPEEPVSVSLAPEARELLVGKALG